MTEASRSESLTVLSLAEVSLTNCSIRCLVVCLRDLKRRMREMNGKKREGEKERENGQLLTMNGSVFGGSD